MITIEEIRNHCLGLNGGTENIKWDDHLCFNVGDKMFLVTAPDHTPISASFKTSDELFVAYSEKEGCKPAPYMAKHKWIFVDDIQRFSLAEWKDIIAIAYKLTGEKLTKKLQKEFGLLN